MPHISNEDLLELMQRILQRVDTIEEKLDLLLESSLRKDEELERVSTRIISNEQYKQNLRNQKRVLIEQRTNLDKELDTEMIVLDHDYIKSEKEWEPEQVLIEMSNVNEPTIKTESENLCNEKETQEQSTDDDDDYDVDEEFQPIANKEDLKRVSRRIKTNPLYLQNLRLHIVEESDDGICTLQQLFTKEFLQKSVVKRFDPNFERIIDLVPYKTVYHYLRKHMGHSLQKIEKDAVMELKIVKQRLRAAMGRKKKAKRTNLLKANEQK